MRKSKSAYLAASLAILIASTSCVGPFRLTNKVLDWNQKIGTKFVNEVVFLAFSIIPVYGVCALADALVFNTIEFWTGHASPAVTQEIKTENGNFLLEPLENGYKLTNTDAEESLDLVFEEGSKTWSVSFEDSTYKLITLLDENNAVLYINNDAVNITLDQAGLAMVQQAAKSSTFFANR